MPGIGDRSAASTKLLVTSITLAGEQSDTRFGFVSGGITDFTLFFNIQNVSIFGVLRLPVDRHLQVKVIG